MPNIFDSTCERCRGQNARDLDMPLCGFRRLCVVCMAVLGKPPAEIALDMAAASAGKVVELCDDPEHEGEEADVIKLEYEDGTSEEFLQIDTCVVDGKTYVALVPCDTSNPQPVDDISEVTVFEVKNFGTDQESMENPTPEELAIALNAFGVLGGTNQSAAAIMGPEPQWLSLDNPICEYLIALERVDGAPEGHHYGRSKSDGTIYEFWRGRGENGQPGYMARIERLGDDALEPRTSGPLCNAPAEGGAP